MLEKRKPAHKKQLWH